MTTGRLWHLDSTPAGATVLADTPAGAVTLAVDDAIALSVDGGILSLPVDGYVEYVHVDLDADTITLAAGLPVALAQGQRVTVPDTMVHTGWVRVDGEHDVRPVRVDHAVAATLPVGPRDGEAAAEMVTITETDAGGLVVSDVLGRPPSVVDVDVRKMLEGYAEELDEVRHQTIVVGRLVTGELLADTLIGVLVGETDQVVIGTPAGGVAYYVPVDDGSGGPPVMVPVTRMGREYAAIDPVTGEQTVMNSGGVSGPVGRFESLEVDGHPLRNLLDEAGSRLVARGHFEQTRGPHRGMTGYAEVGWTARGRRGYVISVDFRHRTNADNAFTEVRLIPSTAPAGSSAPSPLVTDTPIINRTFPAPVGTHAPGEQLETYWTPGSNDVEVRMGLAFSGSSATGSDMIEARILVWDVGPNVPASGRYNLMGAPGTPAPPPSSPPQPQDRKWAFAWEEVYSGLSGQDPSRAGHGSIGSNAWVGDYRPWRYQTILKVQHAQNAMTVPGASGQRLRVRFFVYDGLWNEPGTMVLGLASTGSSSPDVAPALARSMTVSGLRVGAWAEFELPAAWVADILAGTADTIVLGNALAGNQSRLRIRNISHATHAPTLIGIWTES